MFLDIALGLLIASCAGLYFHLPFEPRLIIAAVAGALAPDVDFVMWYIRNGGRVNEWAHKHRDILHYPFLFVLLSWGIFKVFTPGLYGTVFALGSLAHFIHDTCAVGWGIRWLWPFKSTYYAYRRLSPQHALRWYAWTPEEQDAVVHTYGDPQWITTEYTRPSRVLITELIVLIIGIAATAWWYYHSGQYFLYEFPAQGV